MKMKQQQQQQQQQQMISATAALIICAKQLEAAERTMRKAASTGDGFKAACEEYKRLYVLVEDGLLALEALAAEWDPYAN